MTDSTIALIEPVAWMHRLDAEFSWCATANRDEADKYIRLGHEVRALVPATELTTLLQRCEKAEADLINYKLDYLRISHDRIEYRKALQAVDATAAFNTKLGKYMIEPHALDMVSNAIRAGGKQE